MPPPKKKQRLSQDGIAITVSNGSPEKEFDPDLPAPAKKATKQPPRSLFVRSLATSVTTEQLAEHFSETYPLKHATVVLDPATKTSRGFGFVTFADAADAAKAKEEFHNSSFAGKKIQVDFAESRHRDIGNDDNLGAGSKNSKPSAEALRIKQDRAQKLGLTSKSQQLAQPPPKLIVRNLPWSIKDADQLSVLFRSYGKVKHATLPKRKDGLSPGYGFVVIRGRNNAEKALKEVNGKEIDGRKIAVDWAVEKDVWEKLQGQDVKDEDGSEATDEVSVKSEDDEGGGVSLDVPETDVDADEDDEDDVQILSDGSFKDEDEESGVDERDEKSTTTQKRDNGGTLFLRNLPFTTTDDDLFEHFKLFGPVRYARTVMDHETDRPRGTGFVCFYKEEDAKECIRGAPQTNGTSSAAKDKSAVKHSLLEDTMADPTGRYTVDGRVLHVTRAVDRGEAQRLTTDGASLREVRDKDKRRLYLLSEGTVSSDSPLYDSLSPSEIKLREASAKQRQLQIRNNPSLHLSFTRLALRNIPRHFTSKELKALAREAVVGFAKDVKAGKRQPLNKEELSRGGPAMREADKERKRKGKGIVSQAKIVFESREGGKVPEDSGAGRSRGYGFVEFTGHRWALMGLRWLNGHLVKRPTETDGAPSQGPVDGSKRLIVEFSIENAQVVARRRDREQRASQRPVQEEGRADGGHAAHGRSPRNRDNPARFDRKKRRYESEDGPVDATDGVSGPVESEEPHKPERGAKRQQIIGRKRAARKARKAAGG